MKFVIIDADKNFQFKIEKYFIDLGFESYSLENLPAFDCWFENHRHLVIDFIFIGVEDDDAFSNSSYIKQKIKENSATSLIYLLSEHKDSHYIRSLKYGDGYLLKPFGSELLLSTVHYHSKRTQLNTMLASKNKKLTKYHKLIKQEHGIVERIFENHYDQHLLTMDCVKFHISPAAVFNGDVLLTAQGPSGSLYLAVGDVTGHGLPAAIGALPVYSTFKTMAGKGCPIGAIAAEMNTSLKKLLPDNMMMALILMEVDFAKGHALIWSGGMPDVIVVDKSAKIVQKISSRHAPLSVLAPEIFRKDIDVLDLRDGDRLFFYTDGIEESRDTSNEMFGSQRFQSLFSGDSTDIFDNIIRTHAAYTKGKQQDDDITLVEVLYKDQVNAINILTVDDDQAPILSLPWRMQFPLSANEMKGTDPIAQIINFINNAIDIDVHQDSISTVLSELYNNALEHGLLNMMSTKKTDEEGFIEYYIDRKKKLSSLTQGEIIISLDYRPNSVSEPGLLTITVEDSGAGFDNQHFIPITDNKALFGRGLGLLDSLCANLYYEDNGRTAIATCQIDKNSTRLLL